MDIYKIKKLSVLFFCCGLLSLLNCNFSVSSENTETKASKIKLERHFVFESVPMNLEEIVNSSDKIFSGKCISAEEIEHDPDSKLPVLKYTFRVSEGIKGTNNKKEITFKQWLPTVRDGGYEVGKKYVLFLYAESERSLTSPVGLSHQGQFLIEKRGIIRRKEVVRNKLNNRGLNRNLKTQKTILISRDKFINDYIHRCSELGIPMRYKEFITAVKYLVEG